MYLTLAVEPDTFTVTAAKTDGRGYRYGFYCGSVSFRKRDGCICRDIKRKKERPESGTETSQKTGHCRKNIQLKNPAHTLAERETRPYTEMTIRFP